MRNCSARLGSAAIARSIPSAVSVPRMSRAMPVTFDTAAPVLSPRIHEATVGARPSSIGRKGISQSPVR